ncbi:MAG: hypothetical protein M3461_18525 [Pseudomonadota bacterium]|nr:hypothetical protein [Pseudomonadota bacterium]
MGSMNPAIHHPAWYLAGGSLTPEQSEAISVRGGVVIVPQFARFETDRWRVECLPDRWTIFTLLNDAVDNVVDIACSTFERLRETPISAFGLNYDHSGVLRGGTAPFERLMSTLNLEFYGVRQVAFARAMDPISFRGVTLRRQLNVVLEVKAEAPAVLHSNVHHDIELAQSGYFDLSPPLRTAYADATFVTNALADTLLVGEEAQNAHNA